MDVAIRELRDPRGWGLLILTVIANLALGAGALKAAGVALVVLAVKVIATVLWRQAGAAAPVAPPPTGAANIQADPLPTPSPPSPRVKRPATGSPLTARELEVAARIRGHSNKEIGRLLVPQVQETGVDHHVLNIMTKLNVHTRTEIAAWYAENYPKDGQGPKAIP